MPWKDLEELERISNEYGNNDELKDFCKRKVLIDQNK